MLSVAFLRSINVGGHRATKEELIAVFKGLGFEQVSTFLASGNVLFGPNPADPDPDPADTDRIADALEAAFGFAVPTTIRTGPELVGIAEHEPFEADVVAERGKPQVMLLFEPASKSTMAEVLAIPDPDDLLAFGPEARELHWLPSAGMTDSQLDVNRISKLVGTNTTRTINTIRRLVPKL